MSYRLDPDDIPLDVIQEAREQRRKPGTCPECRLATNNHAAGCPEAPEDEKESEQ